MKREKEFVELLKGNEVDLLSCKKKCPDDWRLRCAEVIDVINELKIDSIVSTEVRDGKLVRYMISFPTEKDHEATTFTYDEFTSLYQKYDKDEEATYKILHYVVKDGENHGYPITFESVNIDKEGEICLVWKDHKGNTYLEKY